MSIVVVGTLAFDTIQTPFGKSERGLGGSANYFSLSASHFCNVKCVGVVGEDFPKSHLELFRSRGIDTAGIEVTKGNSFFWEGKYGYELHEATTLQTALNVLSDFDPQIPESYKDSPVVFLANLKPQIQEKVLSEMRRPRLVALDTMNYWIEGERDALIKVLAKVNMVIINESELRQLTQTHQLVQAAQIIRSWGPQTLVIKRGEYGAVLFDHGEVFSLPGLPLTEVKDPTGAGDSFAGGLMGYLAAEKDFSISRYTLRKAVVYGSVMASFTVQDFGVGQLLKVTPDLIKERYQRFVSMTTFEL